MKNFLIFQGVRGFMLLFVSLFVLWLPFSFFTDVSPEVRALVFGVTKAATWLPAKLPVAPAVGILLAATLFTLLATVFDFMDAQSDAN